MFSNFGMRVKFLSVFALVIGSSLVGGWVIYNDLQLIGGITNQRGTIFSAILDARDLRLDVLRVSESADDIYASPKSLEIRSLAMTREKELKEAIGRIRASASTYKDQINASQLDALVLASDTADESFKTFLTALANGASQEKVSSAKEAFEVSLKDVNERSNKLVAELQKQLDELAPVLKEAKSQAKAAAGIATSTNLLLLLFAAIPVVLQVLKGLGSIRQGLLRSIEDVNRTGDSLAAVTSSMSAATAQSAAAIQESVSAMTEMSSMITQTVGHTAVASGLAFKLLEKTGEGSRTMVEMDKSMQAISQANVNLKEINKIIEDISSKTAVINEIVFKTQLLAVNASIEAARAGVHGKGFAVVAGEVSNLATMSGQAASQIRDLLAQSTSKVTSIIEETGSNVSRGEVVCGRATKLFEEISGSLEEMTEKVQQINEAAREQEIGVKQTTLAIDQLSQATSVNNSVAQENTVMCASLQEQSRKLTRIGRALNKIVTGDAHGDSGRLKSHGVDRILDGSVSDSEEQGTVTGEGMEAPVVAFRPQEQRSSRVAANALLRKVKSSGAASVNGSGKIDKSA